MTEEVLVGLWLKGGKIMAKSNARRDDNYLPVMLGVNESGETKELQLTDTTLRLKVDSNSSDGCASVATGRTAHDAEGAWQMPNVSCRRVCIGTPVANGDLANGGVVVVGDSNVVAAAATRQGVAIFPGNSEWFNVSNTNLLYIDVTDATAVAHWYTET